MGISDITGGGPLEGVGISSGRSRGCPAVRTRRGFRNEQKVAEGSGRGIDKLRKEPEKNPCASKL
jgi:hypothetical protein